MRVLFAVQQGEPSPGARYRVLQFLPRFTAAGLQCDVVTVQSRESTLASLRSVGMSTPARLIHLVWVWLETQFWLARFVGRLPHYDCCYLHRVPISGWAARRLTRARARLVYDFDDALDAHDAGHDGTVKLSVRLRRAVWRRSLRRAIRCCRTIVTSNERNAAAIRALGGEAVVVPTSLDVDRYRPRTEMTHTGPITLGWIGTPSTAVYLTAIEAPLRRVLQERDVTVVLVGAADSPFADCPVTVRPWSLDTEVDDVSAFDIGLMPMPDMAWTRGKAALKALQYGAAGLPTVASWTATNEDILGPGGGALLCRTPDDWVDALRRLIDDVHLRQEMGRRARAWTEARYSLDSVAPRLVAILRGDGSA